MEYRNLFIALIFLITLLLIVVTGYIVNHHYRRNRKPQVDVENNLENEVEDDPPEHRRSRPTTVREHYDEEQRLSHLTTVSPSIELLPEIRTSKSSDRAEDWLERRDSRIMEGDSQSYKTPAGKDANASKRKWRDQKKDVARTSEHEEKSQTKEKSTSDRVEEKDGQIGADN